MSAILTTILSSDRDAQICEAIESVRGWVDRVLLIDTGISDRTREVAEGLLGGRLVVEAFEWCGDFARARNFALAAAARQGADWAMTLDTDERMEFPEFAARGELAAALESDPKVRVWMVMEKGGREGRKKGTDEKRGTGVFSAFVPFFVPGKPVPGRSLKRGSRLALRDCTPRFPAILAAELAVA